MAESRARQVTVEVSIEPKKDKEAEHGLTYPRFTIRKCVCLCLDRVWLGQKVGWREASVTSDSPRGCHLCRNISIQQTASTM